MATQKITISGELISKDLSIRQLRKVSSQDLAGFIFSDNRVNNVLCDKIRKGSYEEMLGIVWAADEYSPERIILNFPKLIQTYNQKIKDCKLKISRATSEKNSYNYYRGDLICYALLDEENKKNEMDRFIRNRSSVYADDGKNSYYINCNIKELEYYLGARRINCFLNRFFQRVKRKHWIYNSNTEGVMLFNAMAPSLSKKQFLKYKDTIEEEFFYEAIGTFHTSEEMDLKILRRISEKIRRGEIYDLSSPMIINITSDTIRNLHPKTRNRVFGFFGEAWPPEPRIWIRDIKNNKEELASLFFSLMIQNNGAFERLIKKIVSKENKIFWENNI